MSKHISPKVRWQQMTVSLAVRDANFDPLTLAAAHLKSMRLNCLLAAKKIPNPDPDDCCRGN
ncbi:hypothetical protein [Pelomonas sp. SE-A7]|uniref:hypothetical protein n=1 Tax=Pelomonas sp. SE-A7 TaxID=3054953 RepID=UPI00259CF0D3|nr:hypothetical protein [Pelomonas sp. SE-A7]MDM4766846.1 hypothetical protein [Pelomonas sp. SE-A7]